MLNKFLKKYIPSQYYRDYLVSIDAQFTDSQIAKILYRNVNDVDEMLEALDGFAKETTDTELRQQIIDVIKKIEMEIAHIKTNSGNAIYQVIFKDDNSIDGYAKDFDYAMSMGLLLNKEFQIIKYKVLDTEGSLPDVKDCNSSNGKLGYMHFTGDGKLKGYRNYELSVPIGKFAFPFIEFPNPFQNGDIVTSVTNDSRILGIVKTTKEAYKHRQEAVKNDKTLSEYEDEEIEVSWLGIDGEFYTEDAHPLYLEKVNDIASDNYIARAYFDVIKHASQIRNGLCDMEDFIRTYESYKELFLDLEGTSEVEDSLGNITIINQR